MGYLYCKEFPKEWDRKHVLECVHSYNSKSRDYYVMYCNVLKEMSGGRLKVKVFGYRWRNVEGEKIRYVDKYQVLKAESFRVLREMIEKEGKS